MHVPTQSNSGREAVEDAARTSGTAGLQGELWGARAEAWAEQESQQAPIYEEIIHRVGIGPGATVLDVGCGSGVFLRAAADRGAEVVGLDASHALVEIACARVPEGEIRVGDLQFLPYDADRFDVVTGFNSFQFAADTTAALREARRVAKQGASVVIQVWGRAERCDLTALLRSVTPLLPGPLPTGPGGRALSEPGVLEAMATEAGLTPEATGHIVSAFEYLDEEAMVRTMLSAGMFVLAARTSGEEAVRAAIVDSMAPFRASTGAYHLENEWHYLIAAA
jgi:SAM-dependent methyltransferase